GVLLKKPLIEVAEPLFPCREPVQPVDRIGKRFEVCRLTQLALSIGENGENEPVPTLLRVPEIKQQLAVVLQLIETLGARQPLPTVALGQTLLVPGLG